MTATVAVPSGRRTLLSAALVLAMTPALPSLAQATEPTRYQQMAELGLTTQPATDGIVRVLGDALGRLYRMEPEVPSAL